jgi:lysophospholipase L1-like esterase
LVLVLLALEVSLRAYHSIKGTYEISETAAKARKNSIWKKSEDPILIYSHRGDYKKDSIRYTNEYGVLTSHDFGIAKDSDVYRIAMVGDSITAGIYLSEEKRMAYLLQERMNQAMTGEGKIEVLNFGVNGYSTEQEARQIKTLVNSFKPDLVVVNYCLNDPEPSWTPYIWFVDNKPEGLRLYHFVKKRLNSVTDNQFHPNLSPLEHNAGWELFYDKNVKLLNDSFNKIALWSKKHEVPVLFTIFPFLLKGETGKDLAYRWNLKVEKMVEVHGWSLVNLWEDYYKKHRVGDVISSSTDFYHPNEIGNEIAADAIAQNILNLVK